MAMDRSATDHTRSNAQRKRRPLGEDMPGSGPYRQASAERPSSSAQRWRRRPFHVQRCSPECLTSGSRQVEGTTSGYASSASWLYLQEISSQLSRAGCNVTKAGDLIAPRSVADLLSMATYARTLIPSHRKLQKLMPYHHVIVNSTINNGGTG